MVARWMLECSGWLLGHYLVDAREFWVVARSLLGDDGMFWVVARH